MTKRRRPTKRPVKPTSEADVKLIRQLFLDGMPLPEIAAKFERNTLEIAETIRYANTNELRCSFCNRCEHEVMLLLAGELACICDSCLDISLQIVKESRPDLIQVGVRKTEEDTRSPTE